MWKILLADDHKLVRQGIRGLLEDEPDFVVVGEARDGIEALDLAKIVKPDILVTDLKMPRLDGLEVIRYLRKADPGIRTIMLTMVSDEIYVTEAIEAGAHGYVVKDSSINELIQAIRIVGGGQRYISQRVNNGF